MGKHDLIVCRTGELRVAAEKVMQVRCAAAPMPDNKNRRLGNLCLSYCSPIYEIFKDCHDRIKTGQNEQISQPGYIAPIHLKPVSGPTPATVH